MCCNFNVVLKSKDGDLDEAVQSVDLLPSHVYRL